LTLADLAAYRIALSGKPTADDAGVLDPPAEVSFHDLWNRSDAYRGRRVTIQGRVERTFRQGPVGSFPALAEVWIVSPAGNPFCLVLPQERVTDMEAVKESGLEGNVHSPMNPELGQTIRFTGTFLKMVQFAAADVARLAPLVVGKQFSVQAQRPIKATSATFRHANNDDSHPASQFKSWRPSPADWVFTVIVLSLAAGALAWRHLRAPARMGVAGNPRGRTDSAGPDPPLEFIDPGEETVASAS
jgi:hypothetical protein